MSNSKLIFFGTEDFSVPSLEGLIAKGWQISAVITKPDATSGRGQKHSEPAVKTVAKAAGISVLQPDKFDSNFSQDLKKLGPTFGVLVAYGKIIPKDIIDQFLGGIVNLHPSALPRHRGPSPIEQTILDGDEYTAVSLMKLVFQMDAGPIYSREVIKLTGSETRPQLYNSLASLGAQFLCKELPAIVAGNTSLKPQDSFEEALSLTKLLNKSDGRINWNLTAGTLEKQIRAYFGWPGSQTKLGDVEVTITQTRVINETGEPGKLSHATNRLIVYCSQKALEIVNLKPAGKKEMSAAEFIRGYSARLPLI